MGGGGASKSGGPSRSHRAADVQSGSEARAGTGGGLGGSGGGGSAGAHIIAGADTCRIVRRQQGYQACQPKLASHSQSQTMMAKAKKRNTGKFLNYLMFGQLGAIDSKKVTYLNCTYTHIKQKVKSVKRIVPMSSASHCYDLRHCYDSRFVRPILPFVLYVYMYNLNK